MKNYTGGNTVTKGRAPRISILTGARLCEPPQSRPRQEPLLESRSAVHQSPCCGSQTRAPIPRWTASRCEAKRSQRERFHLVYFCLLLSAFFLCNSARAATFCPDCEVTPAQRAQYDALLNLTPAKQKSAAAKHIPYGMPVAPANATHEHMLHQQDYVTWYDDDLRVPLWVSYRMTKKNITGVDDRTECFRPDPRLAADAAATCADYNEHETNYDQGHLAPNGDFIATEAMMLNTYLYSNITPQQDYFNEHTWERLEVLVRKWCQKRGDLFVISGCVFDQDGDHQRDADSAARRVPPHNRVAIPTHFYKIIFNKHKLGKDECIAILLPHENSKHNGDAWVSYVTSNITTIAEIEKRTGVNFLPGVSAAKRAELENFKAPALWPKQ